MTWETMRAMLRGWLMMREFLLESIKIVVVSKMMTPVRASDIVVETSCLKSNEEGEEKLY